MFVSSRASFLIASVFGAPRRRQGYGFLATAGSRFIMAA
jgi:hypothetical protein